MTTVLGWMYLLAVAGLSLYGFLGLFTLWLYWRYRQESFPCPPLPVDPPAVTVQLPIYNERYVVERLIEAAVSLDYPPHRLQIQVLDDSTDDTMEKAAALVTQYHEKGINISLLHRPHRHGYKAGALANALAQATGEYIVVFDADFLPMADFLRRTIPHFIAQPQLGMIQARWGHLNAGDSPLTAAQAIALDKHFVMEQTVRHRANFFPKFNGSAGIWRRTCLENAGGWEADTVCEDLCLSTRAILKGWQFCFLNDVIAPAELPTSVSAYKNQQARWAKGSIQCLLKYGVDILVNSQHSFTARLYALLSMAAYATHLLLLLLLLLQLPLLHFDYPIPPGTILFTLAGVGQPLLFLFGQWLLYPDWQRRLLHFPILLLIAIGLAPNNSRAMFQALLGRFYPRHPFIRTPKQGLVHAHRTADYALPFDWIILIELSLALYAGLGLILALRQGNTGPLFLLLICFLGFSYTAYLGLSEYFRK